MTHLSVNVNKVATLRNTRPLGIPSVVRAAELCLRAGAAGITIHPRPDQRHIRPDDVYALAKLLATDYPAAELNIEGNPFLDYMHFARDVKPAQCTLVPDDPAARTSDHGWQLDAPTLGRLQPVVDELKSLGCRVSLFMDPDPRAMDAVKRLGADRVELYTEPYAAAFAKGDGRATDAYAATARRAMELGLGVNAGHDLNLDNLRPFLRAVPGVLEVSIGHAFIGDALEFGLAETTRKYLNACGGEES